jgi:TonB-dependent receptor
MLLAQGMVAGKVVDGNTGEYLPGANVMLEGTTMGAASDRQGFFMISDVPEGTYQLLVNYIGYEDYTTEVTISSTELRVVLDEVALNLSAMETDVIVVEGQLEGQLKALNQQRVSPNIKNVVSKEQMELFPDYTTADVVQRVPGVYIDRSQGEGRYVMIRGTEPRLTNVKVNGEELATTRVEERYASMDIIGSNQMASLEVVKALTPDLDGDAIGGTVNLITRSAFDYTGGMRLRATAGAGYTNLRGNTIYQGKFSYSNRFGADRNIGLTITANFDRSDKGAHNSEIEYDDTNADDGGLVRDGWALDGVDLRDYYNIRDRYGLGATFEYRPDQSNRYYIDVMWNRFNDDQQFARKRVRMGKGDYLDSLGTRVQGVPIVIESGDRVEENIQQVYSVGGENRFDNFALDYKISYSFANEEKEPQLDSEWESIDDNYNFKLDYSDPLFVKWEQTNKGDQDVFDEFDAAGYEMREVDYRYTGSSDQNIVGALNFKMPFNLAGYASEFKLGGKVRLKEKDRFEDRSQYKWEGVDTYLDALAWNKDTGDQDFLKNNYRFGPGPDPEKLADFFNTWRDDSSGFLGSTRIWDTYGQRYNAKENIYAGYAMATVNLSDWTVLAGLRYEFTQNDYTGTLLLVNDQGQVVVNKDTTDDRSYGMLMPNLHLKYQIDRMTNIRFAVTRTMARPNYWDLVPYRAIDFDGEEIREGNPNMEITEAWNIDLMVEHYFVGVGVLSGGFFYKDLKNIIFELRDKIDDEGSQFHKWDFRGPVNGGDATIIGFEINWQQQLTFLPGMWSGFGVFANYTKTWAESDLVKGVREGEKALPGQAGDIGNFAISYEWGGFSSRFTLHYQGKYLVDVTSEPDGSEDEWRDDHMQLDISASYKIIPELTIFGEFVNILDQPETDYIGIVDRPIQQEYYGWWMRAGLRFSL